MEVMIAMALIAVLTSVGGLVLTKLVRTSGEGEEIENLKAAIIEARNRAYLTNVCSTVRFNAVANEVTYTIFKDCGSPFGDPVESKTLRFSKLDLENFGADNTISFRTGGGTSSSTPISLEFAANHSGKRYQIRVLPAIGNLRLKEIAR